MSLVSDGSGYRLVLDPDRADAHRFERLVAAARATPAAARARYANALALWRGPTLSGLLDQAWARDSAAGLTSSGSSSR